MLSREYIEETISNYRRSNINEDLYLVDYYYLQGYLSYLLNEDFLEGCRCKACKAMQMGYKDAEGDDLWRY